SVRRPYGTCCYKDMFRRQKIPDILIRSYKKTPSYCSHRAVRVKLLKGKNICVDPEESWFQQYLQKKESTSVST
ncbi:CCL4 protein, partial [Burhinus bistriatus]|nr:CCL4 protein [Burhinus bistriatus]